MFAGGRISTRNSTTATSVAAGEAWEGEWEECFSWAAITGRVTTSGTAQVFVDFSYDKAVVYTVTMSKSTAVLAGKFFNLIPTAALFRVRVVDTSAATNTVTVQVLGSSHAKASIATSRLSQVLDDYSDVVNTRSALFARQPSGAYTDILASEAGHLKVVIAEPLTAFGEVRTSQPTPIVQMDGVYGVMDNTETFTASGGTVTAVNGNIDCAITTTVGSYAVFRSKRALRYRPGQGALFRWTSIFDTNAVANSLQIAGPFNSSSGFLVGYDGAAFGVMHRTGGYHEARTITVSAGASGAETVTLTLNTVAYSIPVTSGTAAFGAYQIAAWLEANQSVWDAWQDGSTVVILGLELGSKAGTYTISSTGTLAGSIAQQTAGVAATETWVDQADFNIDPLDGSGPSGMTIDPAMGNVYAVDMQYLGYGDVDMLIENDDTGRLFAFHRWHFNNLRTVPTLTNPTLKIGQAVASLGSTTALTLKGASWMGAVDGEVNAFRTPRAYSYQRASVGATLTSVLAIRVRGVFRGLAQLAEVFPKIAYVSPEGTRACEIKFLLNPTFAGTTNWTYIDETNSLVEYDITGTTFSSNGTELASFVVAGSSQGNLNFSQLESGGLHPVHLQRSDVLVIAARIVGGAGNNVTASLTWLED
jgi:hypothetical protein